jgi:glyoxylase-like metal-dependent hydrolase (beta-lactamase superfamily II)
MRISCLSTGRVRRKRDPSGPRRYFVDEWSDETLPVNVFLIEHPRGLCLFDTGQTARATAQGYFPSWHPFFRLARFELEPQDEAAAQLRRLGFDVTDVRWVVLSHLHTDHVGGLGDFSAAEVFVSQVEWDRAHGLAGRLRGYLPQYWPRAVEPKLVDFEGPPVDGLGRSFDLASDGTLLLVATPAHTPGHMALIAREGDRTWVFAGDAAESADELEEAAPSLALFSRRTGAIVLTAHDEAAAHALAGGAIPRS